MSLTSSSVSAAADIGKDGFDDVFIGSGAKVIGGLRLGDGCKVGANAVVTSTAVKADNPEVLAARDRDAAAPTFPADGLYFAGPYYDAALGLPEHTLAMDWLP